MAIQGTVPVGGSFAPTNSADSYGTHNDYWGIGGHRAVRTTVARDGIPVNESGLLNLDDELASGRRKLGMLVYVSDEDKFYILKIDSATWDGYSEEDKVIALADNANWVEFVGGGGGGNTGNIGFDANWIKNTIGDFIYISPQDGNTWLFLPSDTQAASGNWVELANVEPDSDGVYITTSDGSWHSWQFKPDGTLYVPGKISFGTIDFQSIGVGTTNSHSGANGISLYCAVGYELNWQAGYLAARDYNSPYDIIDIYSDSLIKYTTPGDYGLFYGTFDVDTLITKGYLDGQQYAGITSTDITNWNDAYGWGDHASAGYLTDAAGSIANDGNTYGRKDGAWAVVSGGISHATASGTDTYTATVTGVAAYNDGDAYLIRFTNGNTTGPTLNINSLGAKTLYRNNDGPLIGGDIFDGGEMVCVYNSTLNGFQCIGASPNSLFAYVTNDNGSTITKGQVVYASGGTGDRMKVKLANNTGDSTSAKTVGVVYSTSIADGQKGIIIMQGLLDGLSILPLSTWADGDSVYLGATAGSITKVKPYAPNHLVYVATVTTASNGAAGRMYVKIQNGYELDEIHDVDLITSAPTTGHYLYFNGTLWTNSASWQGSTIAVTKGGTGFSSYTVGDLLYADTTTSLAKLAAVATGSVLVSTGTAPAWSNGPTLRSILLNNATNANTITLQTGATAASYTLTLPTAAPSGGQYLQFATGGVATWVNGTVNGVTTMAAIGAVPNANGASIASSTLTLQPANDSFGGVVTTAAQTFAGAKTFTGNIAISQSTTTVASYINLGSPTDPTGNVTHVNGVTTGSTFPSGMKMLFRSYTSGYATYIGRSTDLSSMLFACNTGGRFEFWTAFTENIRFNGASIQINNSGTLQQVIGARKTGWAAASGTATRTTFATSTVTTSQLAERVKALIDDLISHGLIGT